MGAGESVGSGGMSRIRLYLDEDAMRKALLFGLRTKLVDVVSALEAGMIHQPDSEHLRWATGEGRVLYSYNTGDYNELCNHLLARGHCWLGGKGTEELWWRANRRIRWGKRFGGCCG